MLPLTIVGVLIVLVAMVTPGFAGNDTVVCRHFRELAEREREDAAEFKALMLSASANCS